MRLNPRHIASALVMRWTTLYTWGLPEDMRNRRRAEMASDLWEAERDDINTASATLRRLLLGIPADLRWRAEVHSVQVASRLLVATLAATAILSTTWWWISIPISLPDVPALVRPPDPDLQPLPPPPPPPPPPA